MNDIFKTGFLPDLIVGKSKVGGRGVFAGKRYRSGDTILEFHGSLYSQAELPVPYVADRYIQVGPDLFLGPDAEPGPEGMDELMNHSCDPNAAVVIKPDGSVLLMAMRPIEPMDEIAYDYSVTMADDSWTMECRCGSPKCRFVIREYRMLPETVKARYRWINVVPPYVLAGDPASVVPKA
jgi:hypothetical protein